MKHKLVSHPFTSVDWRIKRGNISLAYQLRLINEYQKVALYLKAAEAEKKRCVRLNNSRDVQEFMLIERREFKAL